MLSCTHSPIDRERVQIKMVTSKANIIGFYMNVVDCLFFITITNSNIILYII